MAWDDIVRYQLYITGSASTGEYFMSNHLLKNDGQFNIGFTGSDALPTLAAVVSMTAGTMFLVWLGELIT